MAPQIKRFLFSSAMLAIASAIPLAAQTFGEITGRVTDPTGAAIPAAKIFLIGVSTNATRTALSTDSGDYTFSSVAPGYYNLRDSYDSTEKL
jgi:hypothetical protein